MDMKNVSQHFINEALSKDMKLANFKFDFSSNIYLNEGVLKPLFYNFYMYCNHCKTWNIYYESKQWE